MKKTANFVGAAAVVLSSLSVGAIAAPTAASAQVFNCDAPGGRQEAGALIGGVAGALAGRAIAGRRNRTLGTVAGAAGGAALGSAVGCSQQRDRARRGGYAYENGRYRATRTVRVRSGPGTRYAAVDTLRPGDRFDVTRRSGGWVRLDNGGWVNSSYIAMN